jgi:hypothetical protein
MKKIDSSLVLSKKESEVIMIKRTFRVNDYLYSKLKVMSKFYNMSINQLMIELIEIGYLEREKIDIGFKQWRNK